MISIRSSAVAGKFYPEEPSELQANLEALLQHAHVDNEHLKAIIVPHAGYIYSGPIAATAYVNFYKQYPATSRIILMGPAHRVAFNGISASGLDYFATPLGNIPVDHASLKSSIEKGNVKYFDAAHEHEHCLEVQLPFLQEIFDQYFEIIPLLVGDANSKLVAKVLRALWGGDETLIVISSDLSHYHDYEAAKQIDRCTTKSIEQFQGEQLDFDSACGCLPIQGLLQVAKEFGMQCKVMDLRNSGDTAGSHERVVGYGAFAFYY